ncbi:MAG TPA: bifunctional riboflavin kinase/FAD synthetase [Candidatus Binataceae bacterium]|nr:bifunctional riboflavin kinase/FAD synthetase [Candidatus Binataceae bacterium]
MEIIRNLDELPRHSYPVVAQGNFDGVHLGHRAILKAAMDRARAAGGTAFALTFDPLPQKLLFPQRAPRLILLPEDKLELLRISGLDGVIVLNFTREFSQIDARPFVRDFLLGKIGAREVVVGHSVSFGHNRGGNASVMVEMGREFGFDTTVVGPVKVGGTEVSSTKVRELIGKGEVREAAKLLGCYHFLHGEVVRGRERGRALGFPTANIANETECTPPDGVYATRVLLADGSYGSITNVGMRPTFAEAERSFEAHIFDFDRDIYGQRVKLELIERIRQERKFDSPEALRKQIGLDLARAREIVASA